MVTNVLAKNQEVLLTVKRIGINGEGIGYYKRLAVFIPGALPGEEVVVKVTEVNEQYARASLVKIKKNQSLIHLKNNLKNKKISVRYGLKSFFYKE